MSEIGNHKLRDSIPKQNDAEKGKPAPQRETVANQTREEQASSDAHNAKASNRERMVDIGRGNQQAGRQGE